MAAKIMKGAEVVIEALQREGVDTVFGIPGGANLPTFDALYSSPIRVVLTVHEQGAAHMADGYARATGKVGVCLATSGPGATNLVTGLATATMDSIPVVAITGQVKTFMIGNDAFQEADTIGITRPITKHSYLVKDATKLAQVVKEAFHIASTGRPGSVLIDFPADVSLEEVPFHYPDKVDIRGYHPTVGGHVGQVKRAASVIAEAKRPVIYAGGGVINSGGSEELIEFARKTKIPVTTTLLGLGAFPETDPLSLGMLGMHGFEYANYAVTECDLLIAIGARFDDRVTGDVTKFSPGSKKIHIDVDPSSISKTVQVDVPIVGDVKPTLRELNKIVKPGDTREWLAHINEMKEQYPLIFDENDGLVAQTVIAELSEVTGGNAIITTGVGQHQMWVAQCYQFNRPRSLITSGGLGTMGFGLPSAIGAQFGCPDSIVVDVDGDGSFLMTCMELATARAHNLPIKVLVLNNRHFGMVWQWQDMFYQGRHAASEVYPVDLVKLAESFDCVGLRITERDQLRPVLEQAMAVTDRPTVIDCHIKQTDCWPMVAPGKGINEMLGTVEDLKKQGITDAHHKAQRFDPSDLSMS